MKLCFLYSFIAMCFSQYCLAFNYLEHSYFSDLACTISLEKIKKQKVVSQEQKAQFLALSLLCPIDMNVNYCHKGYKQVKAFINSIYGNPAKKGKHSVSFGDYVAWADHTPNYGPLKGIPRAQRKGLVYQLEDWLNLQNESIGGVLEDVAEDSCETEIAIPWDQHKESIYSQLRSGTQVSTRYSLPSQRKALIKGPYDPAGLYSFDNPQYLDLVLNNHHHFGDRSYQTWLGYHATSISLRNKNCLEVYGDKNSCRRFQSLLKKRVLEWEKVADSKSISILKSELFKLNNKNINESHIFLDKLGVSLVSAIYQSAGIHFLQDNFSGGHLRGNRGDLNLEDARYFHDEESKHGVFANFTSSTDHFSFMAYGDDYMLGPGPTSKFQNCNLKKIGNPEHNTLCSWVQQKGMLVAASSASILDWYHGGTLYEKDCDNQKYPFICKNLPTHPIQSSTSVGLQSIKRIVRASLPQPPPSFSYQSLAFSHSFNQDNEILNSGIKMSFLSSLGREAGWLTSYNLGLNYAKGDSYGKNNLEFSYMFHWRWAARFLVNAAPYLEYGEQVKSGVKKNVLGIGTIFGISLLPEGWIRLPLELNFSVKTPLNLYDPNKLKTKSAENSQIFEVSIGLAFL